MVNRERIIRYCLCSQELFYELDENGKATVICPRCGLKHQIRNLKTKNVAKDTVTGRNIEDICIID